MPIKIEYKSEQEVREIPFTGLVSYTDVIDETYRLLKEKNIAVTDVIYKPNANGDTVTAVFVLDIPKIKGNAHIRPCVVWTHSYHKTIRFQCNIAGINSQRSLIVRDKSGQQKARRASEASKYKIEMFEDLALEIKFIESAFENIELFKNNLESAGANVGAAAIVLGMLYVEEGLLTTSQVAVIKDNLLGNTIATGLDVYNCFADGLKDSHPKVLLQDHINLQNFFEEVFLEQTPPTAKFHVEEVPHKGTTASEEIKEQLNYVSPIPSIIFV